MLYLSPGDGCAAEDTEEFMSFLGSVGDDDAVVAVSVEGVEASFPMSIPRNDGVFVPTASIHFSWLSDSTELHGIAKSPWSSFKLEFDSESEVHPLDNIVDP